MLRKILSRMRKAIDDYNMITDGDKIAVGVSGGKDSQLLLLAIKELMRFIPQKYNICAITIDLGFEKFNRDDLLRFYDKSNVEYHVEKTNIAQIVFDIKNESNPCSLCSNMKRGAVYNTAKKLGCNKVAFAHHMDDVVETLMLSLIYEGRIHTFSPVTYLDRKDITLIRPLIYSEEHLISSIASNIGIKPIKSGCPTDGISKRQKIKELITGLSDENKHIKANLFGAIKRGNLSGWNTID